MSTISQLTSTIHLIHLDTLDQFIDENIRRWMIGREDVNNTILGGGNTTLPNNVTTACDPILFNLGAWSREGNNGTIDYGLCPDTYVSFVLVLTFVVFYILSVAVSAIGVILKRKSGHIVARDPTSLYMTMSAGFVFVVGLTMRIIIGRKIFPCGLITLTFFTLAPAVMLPAAFRMLRVYLMYRINVLKMKLFNHSSKDTTTTNSQTLDLNPMNNGTIYTSTMSLSLSDQPLDLKESNSKTIEYASQPKQSGGEQKEDLELQEDQSNEYKGKVKKQVKQLDILNFFVSKKFILPAYGVAFFIGIAIWLILGIVEEVTYNTSTNPNKKRLFLFDGGLFVFDRGCGISTTTMLIIGIHALVYIFLQLIFLILALRADRDTWGIKKETLILILIQFGAAIIFIVVGTLEVTERLLDYLVPTGLALWMYELTEIIMCVGMPVLYAIKSDHSNKLSQSSNQMEMNEKPAEESPIEKVLNNKKTFETLLDFARRSYCTESVLCWRDIQRFCEEGKSNNRKQAAMHILKAYLTYGAPLELNMPKINERRIEIEKVIEENPKIPHDIFSSVQRHCLNDMTDLFERLKSSNKQFDDIVKEMKLSNRLADNPNQ